MTLEDAVAEGSRLVGAAHDRGVEMSLLGGVAVALACRSAVRRDELARQYHDIDLAIPRRHSARAMHVLVAEGYEADQRFNALQGETRLLFNDPARNRPVDIFLSQFQMCHRLNLEPGLATSGITLPASDLLLLKLQIVQLNHKDLLDILALILDFEPSVTDTHGAFNAERIAGICSADWGWYTTVTDNLIQVKEHATRILAGGDDVGLVHRRVDELEAMIEDAPKSLGWRLRNRVGRRLQWYATPDERGT